MPTSILQVRYVSQGNKHANFCPVVNLLLSLLLCFHDDVEDLLAGGLGDGDVDHLALLLPHRVVHRPAVLLLHPGALLLEPDEMNT